MGSTNLIGNIFLYCYSDYISYRDVSYLIKAFFNVLTEFFAPLSPLDVPREARNKRMGPL